MGAADGATAGRKPWRYYYVMAFPLTGSGGINQEKLQEMTEMTTAIEQREEEYLRKVAARNAAHAAALEVEMKAAEDRAKPTLASHVAWVLRRLHLVSVLLLLAGLGVLYEFHSSHDAQETIPKPLVLGTVWGVVLVLVVNVGGWVASYRSSIMGARVLFGIELGLIVGLALLLDEVNTIRRSQTRLQEALEVGQSGFTKAAMDLIINGGPVPSLVQRFIYDAPSEFLQWLRTHCATKKYGYTAVAIDRHEFFSPLWNRTEKSCVAATLSACLRLSGVIQPIIIGVLVITVLQVLFTGLFLAVSDPLVTVKSYKRRRQHSRSKTSPSSLTSSTLSNSLFFRLVSFGTALFGSSNTIASTNLLHFCSIADFETLFTWMMVACLLSGISALFASLLVSCQWKQQLTGFMLVVAVASEVYMLAEFIQMAAEHFGPEIIAESNPDRIEWFRAVYNEASGQTCSSIKRWISHVCVDTPFIKDRAAFDVSCQHEFMALLLASFNFMDSYLAWSIGMKLLLLVQLILPALRQALADVVSFLCCLSSREDLVVAATETSLEQSSLDYDDALNLYLASMRSKDTFRREAERDAFEKEWSTRTGRVLADVRTPNVVVSSGDFGAIVRTLMLRRLTMTCKLDVSLSVSDNGKLLFVRIFASDNLLLASLCETETYCLQFADAIDPGRSFWRDRREVNADQKVLDGPTVKHKLKLLLKDNAMPPKEAVWLPGESLVRVSARVHALSRISRTSRRQIRPCNPAPPFASYSPKIQRQFLYKKYLNKLDIPDTYRRSAVLRTVDCIRLTRRIIGNEFDTNAAIAGCLVSSFHCLHSSSRYDWNSREALTSSWIAFWRPTHLPSEFWPQDHAVLNLIGRFAPFRQPLQDVRDYFGELIAFYFAWLAFYAKMMILPALVAVVIMSEADHSTLTELWVFYTSHKDTNMHADAEKRSNNTSKPGTTLSLSELSLNLGVIVWGFVFAKIWERKSVWYQLQWGVNGSDTSTVSSTDGCDCGLNLDVVHKPSIFGGLAGLHQWLGSWLCILVLGSINLLIVLTLMLAQGLIAGIIGVRLALLGSCICQAFLVQRNGAVISSVAHALNRWENPNYFSKHPAYRRSIVAKLFALQLFNTFTGLLLLGVRDWGVWPPLVRWVTPLRPLYISYSVHIEGRIGVFIEMQSLLIAYFLVRVSSHVFVIVYTTSRSSAKRWTGLYYQHKQEDETLLPPYYGPSESYAQAVVQLGLIVVFSGVCPLLPLLGLVDCAVKLRADAVDLCYVKQRPEPEGVSAHEDDDDDIGLGLWAPCVLLMLKLSVPIALALAFFTADNYNSISLERRIGWWLISVLFILLVAQLFWFLVPRDSRLAEEARARNVFLVERYFGHAEVVEQKVLSKAEGQNNPIDMENSLQEAVPSVEESLHHYEERLELLRRLDVVLRKRSQLRIPLPAPEDKRMVDGAHSKEGDLEEKESHTVEVGIEAQAVYQVEGTATTKRTYEVERAFPVEAAEAAYEVNEGYEAGQSRQLEAQHAEPPLGSSVEDDALQRVSDTNEEMIVGYFRPIPGIWPPTKQSNEAVEDEVQLTTTVEFTDAPRQQSPRRLTMLLEKNQRTEDERGGGDSIKVERQQSPRRRSMMLMTPQGPNVETGGSSSSAVEGGVTTPSRPAPLRLSKLFKRIPHPSAVDASASSDDVYAPLLSASSSSAFLEETVDPIELLEGGDREELLGEKAEMPPVEPQFEETQRGGTAIGCITAGPNPQALHAEAIHTEVPLCTVKEGAISVAVSSIGAAIDSPRRRFSPRLSFLSRKPRSPASSKSEDGSSKDSQVEVRGSASQRHLSPRLSFLSRRSNRSVSRVSDSSDDSSSQIRGGGSPSVPEQPAPRKLSKLFKRVQPSTLSAPATTTPPLEVSPPAIVTEASAFERTDMEDRSTNPVASLREQFDFLSDSRAESTMAQASLPAQRRRSSGSRAHPPSPPPVYARVDLAGLEAVREAASRRQFDFSVDE